MLYDDEICNVRTLYMVAICIYIHKHDELKQFVNHTHETRKKTNRHLKIPISNKNVNLRFMNYLAPKIYILLPDNIKILNNAKLFNKKCKTYITTNYFQFHSIL